MAAIVANCAISLNCELTQPVKVQYIDGNMFSMDNAGNTAHVYVFYNGEPQEIVGSVTADVIRSDGTTVAITGAMSDNRAYVIFPQSCYAVPGVISVVIKVTEGSTVTTIAAFVANVYRSSTDTIVDPGKIIPSVQNLISAIETAVASIPADYSSLWESLAPDYTNITFPVTAGKYCTYNGTLYIAKVDIATTESFTAAHWQSTNIGDNLSALKSAIEANTSALQATAGCVDGVEIERYTKTHDEISGTIKNGYMYDRRGYETQINKWAYLTVSVQPDHAYLVSGTASTNARLYTILDANDNVIALADSDSTVRKENVKCITPSNAATLIVNANTNQGDPSVKDATNKYTYDGEPSSPIAVETSTNIYTIDGGEYETVVQLYGTPNGTVKMDTLNRSGSAFKALTDDVTPVNFDAANYVGANHGYEFGVKMTITEHGLTTANIGSVYSDTSTGYEWVLLYIVDTNNVMTCALNANRWYGMANVPVASMPSTVNFGTGILTVSSTEKTAIFPSVKNVSISVVENNAEHFAISEEYDIIDPSVGLAWIQNNVGSCGNTSFALHSDSLVTVRNLYNFDASGNCVISQNLITVKSAELDFYGGVQSMRFSTSDRFAVLGTTYNKLTSAPASGGTYFDRNNTWNDASVPPICYIQSDGDAAGYTKLFISIILMNGRNALLKTNAGFYQSTHKMYPYAIEIDDTVAARIGYGLTSVRVPVYAGSDAYCFRTFKANGRDYGFFAKRASGLVHITMPEELRGKNVTVLARSNCRILADTVVNVFDIYATDEAYMLMEFD